MNPAITVIHEFPQEDYPLCDTEDCLNDALIQITVESGNMAIFCRECITEMFERASGG